MKILNGLDLQSQRIQNVATPSTSTDAVNKAYVDNVSAGMQWKAPVRAASTGNIAVAIPGAAIDGVTLVANDRVLLKNQTVGAENGLYIFNGAAAAMMRSLDGVQGDISAGVTVTATEGTVNADKSFICVTTGVITVGTTATTWSPFAAGQTYAAGNGIQISSNVVSAVAAAGGGVSVVAGGIQLDTTVAARKFSTSVGNGALTSIAVTHNLGTQDVVVSVRDAGTNAQVIVDWVATDINTVTLTFATAPASNAYRTTVVG